MLKLEAEIDAAEMEVGESRRVLSILFFVTFLPKEREKGLLGLIWSCHFILLGLFFLWPTYDIPCNPLSLFLTVAIIKASSSLLGEYPIKNLKSHLTCLSSAYLVTYWCYLSCLTPIRRVLVVPEWLPRIRTFLFFLGGSGKLFGSSTGTCLSWIVPSHEVHYCNQCSFEKSVAIDEAAKQFIMDPLKKGECQLNLIKSRKFALLCVFDQMMGEQVSFRLAMILRFCRPTQHADDLVSREKEIVLNKAGDTEETGISLMKSPSIILVILYSPIP